MSTPTPAGVPTPGEVIATKYRVERVLGAGGMGVVVEATHLQLEERVAIKVLLPALLGMPDVVERFLREGRAAVRIRSEHVGRVLDVATVSEGGAPCIVMEYLEGQDLSRLVQERGRLPVREAAEYVLQATEALAEAHKAGIVHRDLKPANLFLTHRADGSPCIKVLDFGIAKVHLGENVSVTKTHMQMGSPLYMAPEQLRSSRQVDARADIWSLGVVLHELVSGKPPFDAESLAELAILVATEPPQRLLEAEGTARLQAVIDRCLEKAPDARFPTVGAFAEALAAAADSDPARMSAQRVMRVLDPSKPTLTTGAASSPDVSTAVRPAGVTARSWTSASTVAPRKRWGMVAAVATVVAVAVAGFAGRSLLRRDAAAPSGVQSAPPPVTSAPVTVTSTLPPPMPPPAAVPFPLASESRHVERAPVRNTVPAARGSASVHKIVVPATSQQPHMEDLH